MKLKWQLWTPIIRREAKLISRDINILAVVLIAPLIYGLFYPSVYWHKGEQDVPVVVVDTDHSALSRTLIRSLDAHRLVAVQSEAADYGQAKAQLETGAVQGIVYIPSDFSKKIKKGQGVSLKIFLNTSRFLVSNDMNLAINEVVATLNAGIRINYFKSQGLPAQKALPLQTEVRTLFNPALTYGDFLIPGLLVLILQQTLLIGLAESFAKEREEHTIKQLFELAGHRMDVALAGKAAFYLALFGAYSALFYGAFFSLFHIPLHGNLWALTALTVLFLITVIYISLLISSFFKRKIVALQFLVFTSYPVFLLSGYSWPLSAMPGWLRVAAQLLPGTPYLNAFVRITQMGAGWGAVWPQFLHLAALAFTGFILIRWRLYRLLKKEYGVEVKVFERALQV
ncbi:hypothetical protein DRI50_11250 [candidate division KSB1 bacterium]|nr:MAG: hypothetical protein DRI50_11250 [candidate division KSB1 bacterium]